MSGAIRRSILVALGTIAVLGLGRVVYIVALCEPHWAWQRVQRDKAAVVLDSGEGVARAGDAIFVCDTPHALGPLEWHRDLDCYCAPRDTGAASLGDVLGGTCALSELTPTPADADGACRHAHCSHHVDF